MCEHDVPTYNDQSCPANDQKYEKIYQAATGGYHQEVYKAGPISGCTRTGQPVSMNHQPVRFPLRIKEQDKVRTMEAY
jgi:hypothetical protein